MHVELVRVSGAAPERLSGGDDSSENSSESSCYEVMDTNGEIVHMAKRLTCRVGAWMWKSVVLGSMTSQIPSAASPVLPIATS